MMQVLLKEVYTKQASYSNSTAWLTIDRKAFQVLQDTDTVAAREVSARIGGGTIGSMKGLCCNKSLNSNTLKILIATLLSVISVSGPAEAQDGLLDSKNSNDNLLGCYFQEVIFSTSIILIKGSGPKGVMTDG
eukprot:scaffold2062_cov273-Chaetoceros_neogracile.AAC.39